MPILFSNDALVCVIRRIRQFGCFNLFDDYVF